MKKILIPFLFFVSSLLFAQMSEEDVRARLELVHGGKIDQVRSEISSLRIKYPGDPGVLFLDGYVTEEGSQAVKKYQELVDNYPKSMWADDALYKIYQYYYSIGLYKTAENKLAQLNREYPNSIYAKKDTLAQEKTVFVPIDSSKTESVETATTAHAEAVQPVPAPGPSRSAGPWVVQVGVYSQEARATEQSNAYTRTVGRQAIVFQKQSSGRTMYAVAFDGFDNEKDARSFGADLKAKYNMDWFIVKR